MYFWNTTALKQKLADRPLTDAEAFPYYLAESLLIVVGMAIAAHVVPEQWNTAYYLAAIPVTAWGLYHAYARNGGAQGVQFLPRVVSLGWVLSVRLLVLSFLVGIALYVLVPEAMQGQADFAANLALTIGYFWRLGVHMQDVAAAAAD